MGLSVEYMALLFAIKAFLYSLCDKKVVKEIEDYAKMRLLQEIEKEETKNEPFDTARMN